MLSGLIVCVSERGWFDIVDQFGRWRCRSCSRSRWFREVYDRVSECLIRVADGALALLWRSIFIRQTYKQMRDGHTRNFRYRLVRERVIRTTDS